MLSENLTGQTLRPIFSNALTLKLETIKLDVFIKNFSRGQTLPGKVVQALPEQKAVVEIQGEKLLLQFPRPVSQGQNLLIKIEQVQPNPVLKLISPPSGSQTTNAIPPKTSKASDTTRAQTSDKTSIQSRPATPIEGERTANKGSHVPAKPGETIVLRGKEPLPVPGKNNFDFFSKGDLKRMGIETGQSVKAEVARVVGRESLLVRFQGQEVVVKSIFSQAPQTGDPIHIQARPLAQGKFQLEAEPLLGQRFPISISVLKNYLPARQPLYQVISGLKEVFLDQNSGPFKSLNIDPVHLKQLQDNLQKLVSGEIRNLDGPQVKEVVDRSGFHYEAKLKDFVLENRSLNNNSILENDLKGQLMRLARQLDQVKHVVSENSPADKLAGKLVAQVNQAVSNIELQQLTHHFSKEVQQPLLMQLPENFLGEQDRFKIYILPDRGEGQDSEQGPRQKTVNLVFLLNLSALGDLRIETRVHQNDVSILIQGTDPEVIQFIESHVSELEGSLKNEGLSVTIKGKHQDEILMEMADGLGQLLVNTPLQMVDIKT